MASEGPARLPTEEPQVETPINIANNSTTSVGTANQAPRSTSPSVLLNIENPPPKPPRPMSPQQQAQATLQEAFPSIDVTVVRAVLVASGGKIEPAFTALLSMSDPSVADEEIPPPQLPRPRPGVQSPQRDLDYDLVQTHTEHPQRYQAPGSSTLGSYMTSTPRGQLEADEIYARQLAEHFGANSNTRPARSGGGGEGSANFNARDAEARRRQQPPRLPPRDEDYDSEKERSFLDDDLPVIKENIRKGFVETQNKFNSWITDFKKRLDGDSPENSPPSSARNSGQYSRPTNRPVNEAGARSSRDGGYDADPRVLSDDFTHLHLRDNTTDGTAIDSGEVVIEESWLIAHIVPQPRRPKANPGLFQPSPVNKIGRKVSFEDRPTNISDEDLYRPAPNARSVAAVPPARQPSPATASKWEPLKSVEPAPMDRDPFSLGDSDDEREAPTKEPESAKPVPLSGVQEIDDTTLKETK